MTLPFDSQPETLVSKILIVDDEPVVRDVLSRLLSREADLSVVVAELAGPALEALAKERFDLLVTDKNLPGMGGIELLSRARSIQPQMEGILITGYPSAESMIAALASGASDYLVKPFDDLRVVRAKVRNALGRRRERLHRKESSTEIARQASQLLQQGNDAPEPAWVELETRFSEYEQAIGHGGCGRVKVLGDARLAQLLSGAELAVEFAGPVRADPCLWYSDVVVTPLVEGWTEVAEALRDRAPDVLLVASQDAEMADLLEAIALRLEVVDDGDSLGQRLGERVRGVLMRRAVERAQERLAEALATFKGALASA
jgi:CheY-like chemotaxis protein